MPFHKLFYSFEKEEKKKRLKIVQCLSKKILKQIHKKATHFTGFFEQLNREANSTNFSNYFYNNHTQKHMFLDSIQSKLTGYRKKYIHKFARSLKKNKSMLYIAFDNRRTHTVAVPNKLLR